MTSIRSSNLPLQWLGLMSPPVAWAVQMLTVYTLAPWSCAHGPLLPLHVVSALSLLIAASGSLLAWRSWRAVGGWPSSADEATLGRTRLMTLLGAMTGTLFSLVISAQWLAVFLLEPCPR